MKLIFFSLPRSGSTWLGKEILGSNFKYFDEYFNHARCPVCKFDPLYKYRCEKREFHHEKIKNYFGSIKYWKAIGETTKNYHKEYINKTWFTQNKYNLTKEVLSFCKIDAYKDFYDSAFCLYRTRLMTFPGTANPLKTEKCFINIWKSLLHNKEKYDKKIKEMLKIPVESKKDIMYASHAISSYMLLRSALINNLPIIEYQNIQKQFNLIPNNFYFNNIEKIIEEKIKIIKKKGFPDSEKIYSKISEKMDPEIRDYVMRECD